MRDELRQRKIGVLRKKLNRKRALHEKLTQEIAILDRKITVLMEESIDCALRDREAAVPPLSRPPVFRPLSISAQHIRPGLPNTILEYVMSLPGTFDPKEARGVNATIQFRFTGPEPSNFVVSISQGICTVAEGVIEYPELIVDAPSDVWLKIARHELDASTAFMSGQFTFTGDMGILMQMSRWFRRT